MTFAADSTCGLTEITLDLPPRPLSPDPVFPIGTGVSPSHLYVSWRNAIDPIRSRFNWPVSYDIYFKHWLAGEPEPQDFTLSATLPCNPNMQGNCSTYVEQIATGMWKWKVVARLDVSAGVPVPGGPSWTTVPGGVVLSTESSEAFFETSYSGRPPGCCR